LNSLTIQNSLKKLLPCKELPSYEFGVSLFSVSESLKALILNTNFIVPQSLLSHFALCFPLLEELQVTKLRSVEGDETLSSVLQEFSHLTSVKIRDYAKMEVDSKMKFKENGGNSLKLSNLPHLISLHLEEFNHFDLIQLKLPSLKQLTLSDMKRVDKMKLDLSNLDILHVYQCDCDPDEIKLTCPNVVEIWAVGGFITSLVPTMEKFFPKLKKLQLKIESK
jgi:hypothetical protein